MILVSACLCGVNCKYSGGNNFNDKVHELFKDGKAMPICPEVLGGLDTPRPPHEIIDGDGRGVLDGICKVKSKNNIDSTEAFLKGAYETLNIAKTINPEYIILKANSPSCGFKNIYNGKFDGSKIHGNGVTAELLFQHGYKVLTEEDL